MPLLLTDLDETLLGRRDALRRWATGFVGSRGLPVADVEQILDEDRYGARSRPDFVTAVNARLRLDPPLTIDYLDDYVRCFVLADDTANALATARAAGWRIAIASNGEQPQLDKIEHVGLAALVDAIAISALDGSTKPDPELLRIAARRAGTSLEGAWMLGDDPVNDIGAAHAAGIRSVWLRHGRSWPVDLLPPTADADTFAEAVSIVLGSSPATAHRADPDLLPGG